MRTKPFSKKELVEIIGELARQVQWRAELLDKIVVGEDEAVRWAEAGEAALASFIKYTEFARDDSNSDLDIGVAYLLLLAENAEQIAAWNADAGADGIDPPGAGTDGNDVH